MKKEPLDLILPCWTHSPSRGLCLCPHRRSAWIKKSIWQKLFGAPNNLGFNPDSVRHLGAPWWPFQIFWRWYHVLIEGVLGSKNLFSESCSEWPITYVYTPFQTPSAILWPPSAILWPPGGHFGFFEKECSDQKTYLAKVARNGQ